jgi:DNA polymerase
MTKIEMLKLLKAKVCQCQKCPELVANRTQIVFDNINYDEDNHLAKSGNPDAKIILIGEGPGRDEDLQGIPFVGRCGQLLTDLLTENGLKREELYICNIVKCRPPKNRPPEDDEKTACKPYLDLQLKVVNPKYIVCMGAIASQSVLEVETPISYLRGKWHNVKGHKVMCTFHPAYLLRNPSAKEGFSKDLQLLVEDIKSGT